MSRVCGRFDRNPPSRSAAFLCRLATSLTMVLSTSSGLAADPLPEAGYLPEKTVAVAMAKPSRLLDWEPVRLLRKLGMFVEKEMNLGPFTLDDIGGIDQIVVAIDQPVINDHAYRNHFAVRAPAYDPPSPSLRKIGEALHEYHEKWERFPRANGDGYGQSTGLSWRVHVLPFLGQETLFKQFHLDEPWDSAHNKSLIARMPKVFAVEGVKEPGKTSIHVVTGEKTPLRDSARRGNQFRDFSDGTSNTILAVEADPALATEWTKPGGLPFDPRQPLACLGERPAEGNLILLADGTVKRLSPRISEAGFTTCVDINDGQTVDSDWFRDVNWHNHPFPTAIITFRDKFDPQRLASLVTGQVTVGPHIIHDCNGFGVWFAHPSAPTTVVVARTTTLQSLLKSEPKASPNRDALVKQLDITADISVVANLAEQKALLVELAEFVPEVQEILGFQVLSEHMRLTDLKAGDAMLWSSGVCATPTIAEATAAKFRNRAEQLQALIPAMMTDDLNEEGRKLISGLGAGWKIELAGNTVKTSLIAPKGIEQLPQFFEPALIRAAGVANATRQRNHLKNIGLAFHNFEYQYSHLPSAAGRGHRGDPQGLSWRVHLLPYLDEAELHKEFHLDEPWDSPHNLPLAARMPDVFKTPGVTEADKTSIHVFTGEGTPFDKEKAPSFRDFHDGLGRTLLVVRAGPDKAEIWTKPGGLALDPKDPVASLGKLDKEGFYGIYGHGVLELFPADINAKKLLNLVRHKDGK